MIIIMIPRSLSRSGMNYKETSMGRGKWCYKERRKGLQRLTLTGSLSFFLSLSLSLSLSLFPPRLCFTPPLSFCPSLSFSRPRSLPLPLSYTVTFSMNVPFVLYRMRIPCFGVGVDGGGLCGEGRNVKHSVSTTIGKITYGKYISM